MPMGTTHRRINTALSIPLTAGALTIGWSPLYTVGMVVGYTFATFFMNPDLDLYSLGYKSWGWLRFIWWPYQKALGHRSFASHFPVISTILRIIYLLWFPILLLFLLSASARSAFTHDDFPSWLLSISPYAVVFVIGMILSDSIHAILDVSSTELKHIFHAGRRRRHESFFDHHNQAPPRRVQVAYSRNRGGRAPSRRRRY